MSTPDMLEIINGPEDGTEFPINRAPVIVGRDPGCAVNVRLDETVQPLHARLTAVGDGYRVRKVRSGYLSVNGKPAGMIRSRILREGGILQVGNTELSLCCAPDGLARRSRGLPTENDFVWFVRIVGGKLGRALWRAAAIRGRKARFVRWLLILFVLAMAAGYVRPGLLAEVLYYIRVAWSTVLHQIDAYSGGLL